MLWMESTLFHVLNIWFTEDNSSWNKSKAIWVVKFSFGSFQLIIAGLHFQIVPEVILHSIPFCQQHSIYISIYSFCHIECTVPSHITSCNNFNPFLFLFCCSFFRFSVAWALFLKWVTIHFLIKSLKFCVLFIPTSTTKLIVWAKQPRWDILSWLHAAFLFNALSVIGTWQHWHHKRHDGRHNTTIEHQNFAQQCWKTRVSNYR